VRFHLIDRLDLVEPGQRVRGRKLTSWAEEYWRDTGQGPEMPPPLVLESLCQAATWLVMATTGFRLRAALLSIDEVHWDGPVRPGDVLELDGTVESMSDEMAVLSGTAAVGTRTVLRAGAVMCALIPADDLEDPDAVSRMYEELTMQGSDR